LKKSLFFWGLIIISVLSGCQKSSTSLPEKVEIGALLSLTGNWSSLGITSQEAIALAITDVNSFMQQKGKGLRFSASTFETKLDATLAKEAINAGLNKKIKYFIGPQSSAELAAVKPIADANNLLLVSQGSTASSLAIADDGIFRFCPGDVVEGPALAATMIKEGKKVVITLSRDDEGNKGLQQSVGKAFTAAAGQVDAQTPYAATSPNIPTLLATLKSRLQTHIAALGADKVCVYLASFDEGVDIMAQASADPVFAAVKWYGGDGIVLSPALTANAQAAGFAAAVGFVAPNFGLPATSHPDLSVVSAAIKSKTGLEPDAYALAAYDAVWVIARTVESMGSSTADFTTTKNIFKTESNKYFGITGQAALNAAGDRSIGVFDYWGIALEAGKYKWIFKGKSS
jgi:branched-chain amino acid transport system substrate-binding protein